MFRIEQLRKEKGLTQDQLAKMLGLAPHTVNRWERGHHMPNAMDLRRMAGIFECSLEALYDDLNPPQPSTPTEEQAEGEGAAKKSSSASQAA